MKAWFKHKLKLNFSWFREVFNNHRPAVKYFAHIPKTAGTSFIVLLDRFFQADKIFPQQLWREVSSIDVTANQQYDLFRGHFGGGGVGVLTDKSIEYLTILRSPETLALSTYQFVKREQNTKVHELVVDQDMGFVDFLSHPETVALVSDRMVRNLSFDFRADPAAQEVFLSAETIEHLHHIITKTDATIDDEQRLSRAKQFIQRCQWFGLLERFDESLQLLCYTMSWPPFGPTQKLNTHQNPYQLTADEAQLVASVNQHDQTLYDWAEAIFEQKFAAMQDDLARYKTPSIQNLDEMLDTHYQQQRAVEHDGHLPAGMKFGFDQVLLGSQWHRRELMQPENEYFRWTGPGKLATIDFWLKPVSYVLTLRIINATSVELLERMKLTLNGHVLQWQSMDEGLVRVVTANIPTEFMQPNGLARLGLDCIDMVSHKQAFDSTDNRLVGVAVHWIRFDHEG